MALKADPNARTPAAQKAAEVFGTTPNQNERLSKLPRKTEPVSFRLPAAEKARIEALLTSKGYTMAQAAKRGLYLFLEAVEAGRVM